MKEVSELLTALGTFLVGVASLIKVCKQKEQPNMNEDIMLHGISAFLFCLLVFLWISRDKKR